MTSVLHASNPQGPSLEVAGGTAEAVNCTFAGNANCYGIVQTGGGLALRNHSPAPPRKHMSETTPQSSARDTPPVINSWVHPIASELPTTLKRSLLVMQDGSLLGVDADGIAYSHDDGVTWSETLPAAFGQDPAEPASCYVLEPAPRTLVMVFLVLKSERRKFGWDEAAGEPVDGCCLELQSIRSLDGGRTWQDRQTLLDGCNANFFGFIQTKTGRLVLTAEHLETRPGRWVVCSLISDDAGLTWRRSNLIDLGGHGHHDGALEPTVAELGDGRLLMLIRTNLSRFWQAGSEDGGRYWRTLAPTTLDASSAPGYLLRLRSGRLVFVWNRMNPEGGQWPLQQPSAAIEVPASWYREELSITYSDDDAQSWSKPLVLAHLRGGQISYPLVLERRPGELWVLPGFVSRKWFNEDPVPLKMRLSEAALVGALA